MEKNLEVLPDRPFFPGKTFYRSKSDGFIYSDHVGGPVFWEKIGNKFVAEADDLFVASYPRTGTTWATELIYLITSGLDYEGAKNQLRSRAPYINFSETPPDAVFNLAPPRLYRTHLPYAHLPESIKQKKCKIIYTVRNPKDTLVSYYNFGLMNKYINYTGDFETFVNLFLNDEITCGPFWKHVLQYWEHRNDDNVFILSYEERKKDFPASIRKLAEFLGKTMTDSEVEELAKYCSFTQMKNNPAVNLSDVKEMFDRTKSDFIRKGEVGDWKNYFTEELNQKMDEYVEEHFKDSGLEFVYEL